ncbi:hypothetical protein SPRG_16752 [Saprolegnia parasitica CBS 223.65]|uniref:Uncharacterized protein n=1 Tax=Saprolegnia parasitica (strain CBS 223.65) TaxID=695850 RepID=A0A067BHE3_SAPPC|nr:hypothetical protein SPRG_16752 [Saprolegnia parasitica CBS 223.65]KDO17794.1 hypothetical protein SPRG_16752 [Saprolegnia parasitica CBS 223.65]|eukprot:XP_012211499.1 hypothetical protein SPRG_16752 [Saprolegnia parasitica CBS 223.65]
MKMLVLPRSMDGVGTSIKLKAIGSVTTSLWEYMAVASIGDIPPHLQAGLLSAPLRSTTAIAASSIASKDVPVKATLVHQDGEMSAHDVDPTCIPAPLRARLAAETDPSQCKAVNLVASETPGIKLLQGPSGQSRTIRMATSARRPTSQPILLKDGILGRDGHAVVVTPPQCVSSGSGRVSTVLRLGRVQEGAPAIVQQACLDNVVAAEVASLSASKELQRVRRHEEAINVGSRRSTACTHSCASSRPRISTLASCRSIPLTVHQMLCIICRPRASGVDRRPPRRGLSCKDKSLPLPRSTASRAIAKPALCYRDP